MGKNARIPGIDVPLRATVIFHISGWAHKDTGEMHQFAEGEICQQGTDQKEMDVENCTYLRTNCRRKCDQANGQLLNINNINIRTQKVAHQNAGQGNAEDEYQREIIVHQET